MNIVKMILKEAGGRLENAAGTINSKDNMFAGSSGNAISDKLGGGENNNPIEEPNEETEDTETADTSVTDTEPATTETPETDATTDDTQSFSDKNLKSYQEYRQTFGSSGGGNKGKLKNLDLNPMSQKPATDKGGSGSGGMGAMASMFKGIMGAGGEGGADMGGDMGADASDMSDMGDMADAGDAADAASDARLKNIFGDNEDIIKTFAKIKAIEFTYNDKAKDIPGSENKGVDDDVHLGIKAQDLATNPLTASAVSKDPESGYLQVDTKELTTANSAVISELCRRIEILEKILGVKVV